MSGHESAETPIGNELDTQAHIDRSEQRMRLLHVSDRVMSWDRYDDFSVATLPVEFRMPDIERYMGIRYPISTCSCTTLLCAGTD